MTNPTRTALISQLADRIITIQKPHPVRVAIDGIDAAGKTTLANELAQQITDRPVIRASIDNFHRPATIRYQRGRYSPEGYYLDSFNLQALKEYLLAPLGPRGNFKYRMAIFDHQTDSHLNNPTQTAPPNAILLLDGIFLHRSELLEYWDFSIFLTVDFSISIARGLERHRQQFGTVEGMQKLNKKRYVPGQQYYLNSVKPTEKADILINNNRLDSPFIIP